MDATQMGHMWVKELADGRWGAWWERDCEGHPYFTGQKDSLIAQVALASNRINAG